MLSDILSQVLQQSCDRIRIISSLMVEIQASEL